MALIVCCPSSCYHHYHERAVEPIEPFFAYLKWSCIICWNAQLRIRLETSKKMLRLLSQAIAKVPMHALAIWEQGTSAILLLYAQRSWEKKEKRRRRIKTNEWMNLVSYLRTLLKPASPFGLPLYYIASNEVMLFKSYLELSLGRAHRKYSVDRRGEACLFACLASSVTEAKDFFLCWYSLHFQCMCSVWSSLQWAYLARPLHDMTKR